MRDRATTVRSVADSAEDFPQLGLSDDRSCPRCGLPVAKGAKRCPEGHTHATEAALARRSQEAFERFDPYKHPRGRGGEFRGVPGSHLRRVIDDAQRLGRVHSKLRLRIDGGEEHLVVHADVVGRAKAHAEEELAVHGYHLTPQNQVVRTDQDIPTQTPEDRQSFWAARREEAQHALDAATDPTDREMLGRHIARLGDQEPELSQQPRAEAPGSDSPGEPDRLPSQRIPGAGAVVNGKPGRWITALGKMVHVPHHDEWSTLGSNGTMLTSPAGTTDVYRAGELVSQSGKRATHADVIRPPRSRGVTPESDTPTAADPEPSQWATPRDRMETIAADAREKEGGTTNGRDPLAQYSDQEITDAADYSEQTGDASQAAGEHQDVFNHYHAAGAMLRGEAHDRREAARAAAATDEPVDTSGDRRDPPTEDDPPVIAPTDNAPVDPLAARRERAANIAATRHQAQLGSQPADDGEPVEPGSLAGADLTSKHPRAIDTELARLWGEQERAERQLAYLDRDHEQRRARLARSADDVRARQDAHMAEERTAAEKKVADLHDASKPLEDEFNRRGGWARYFLVQNGNGHVHSSTRCSTCVPPHIDRHGRPNAGTQFAWLPDLAAKTEQQMVAEHGEAACSVCFPSAPSLYEQMKARGELSTRERATQAERDARMAERAERHRLRDAKAIRDVDGRPLRTDSHGEIKTLVTARNELVSDMVYVLAGEHGQRHGTYQGVVAKLPQRRQDVEKMIAAIAAKIGESPDAIRATAAAKALVKARRDWGVA